MRPTPLTMAHLGEALLLLVYAGLVAAVIWWMAGGWVTSLGVLLGRHLSDRHPGAAALAVLVVAASTMVGAYRLRRRRLGVRSAAKTARVDAPTDPTEILAYAFFGALCAALVSRDGAATLAYLFGRDLAERFPTMTRLAGLAVAIVVLIALIQLADRRKRDQQAAGAVDPVVAWMRRRFRDYGVIVMVTVGLGVTLQVARGAFEMLVATWIAFYPWTPLALALAGLAGLADSLLSDYYGARPRPTIRMAAGKAGQSVLFALVLGTLAMLLLYWNYRGLLDSSALFARVSPATRVAFFAMPALFLAFVLAMLLRYARLGRRTRVLISFQHAREDTAQALQEALGASGLVARRIPYRGDYQHDRLLRTIQEEIRRCDAVVCLPGTEPSFVENEILVASTLRKFIVFVVGAAESRLPNTAFPCYPVFRLERVEPLRFTPLAELILLVAGHWRASLRYFLDSWTRLFSDGKTLLGVVAVFVGGTYLIGIGLAALPGSGTTSWAFLTRFHRIYLDLLGNWVVFWIWFNAFLVGCVFALVNQLQIGRAL